MTTHDIPINALAEANGVFFLTLAKGDRQSVATTIERLINMLDEMEGDPDLEPWLGSGDDREADCEDEGAQCEDEGAITGDDEFSLGWSEAGSLVGNLSAGSFGMEGELEPELGWTEEVDQSRRLEMATGWMVEGSEPDLGWAESFGKGIVGSQNCLDDREHDDSDRELNGDEHDYSQSEDDGPISFGGNGSGLREAHRLVEKARRMKSGEVVREMAPRRSIPADAIPMLRASDFDRLPWADHDAYH